MKVSRRSLLSVALVFAFALWPSVDQGLAEDKKGPEQESTGTTTKAEPGLEQLLEINSALIFGGKATISGERLEVYFDQDGQLAAGFEGKGIIDSKSEQMKGANRNFIILEKKNNVETLVKGLCAVGMGDGTWTTRFPLGGESWVEVNVRVPNLIGAQSNLKLRVNWDKSSGYETNFFNNVYFISDGATKGGATTQVDEYKPHASKWFPRKSKTSFVKAGFGIRDGKCLVQLNGKEIANLGKVSDRGGKVSIQFSKLAFTLDNLKVSGKLDRKWAEKEIARLRKAGTLKLKADPVDPNAPGK